jgi:hypothetical protein
LPELLVCAYERGMGGWVRDVANAGGNSCQRVRCGTVGRGLPRACALVCLVSSWEVQEIISYVKVRILHLIISEVLIEDVLDGKYLYV